MHNMLFELYTFLVDIIEINVIQEKGHVLSLEVESFDTIANVKFKLSKRLNISKDEQELQYKQRILQDDDTLFHCKISNGSLLYLSTGEKAVV